MGGHDDEDMPYVVSKHKQEDDLNNKLWCDQEPTANNTKWLKEGQNQLRKENQDQDHNCNISHNGNVQSSTQDEQQGNEEHGESPKRAPTPSLSHEESKNILNETLAIDRGGTVFVFFAVLEFY